MPNTREEILKDLERWNNWILFRVPLIDHPISINKIHALTYGFVLGIILGRLAWNLPLVSWTLAFVLVLMAYGKLPAKVYNMPSSHTSSKDNGDGILPSVIQACLSSVPLAILASNNSKLAYFLIGGVAIVHILNRVRENNPISIVAKSCPGGKKTTIAIETIRYKPHYYGFSLITFLILTELLGNLA